MRLKADILLFIVAIIWGTAFVAQGVAGGHGIAYLFNGVSFMLASLILFPFIKGTRGTKITKEQWKWMLIAGSVLCFATAMQQVGLFYTKVANASFLTSLYAVFTPFLLWIGFQEKPHRLDLFAVTLAGIGAFLLSTAGQFQVQVGDALELTGSLFWALHFVVLGKSASKFESVSFASGHFFISGFINLLIGLFVEDVSTLTVLPVIGAILYRATLSVGIGYTLQVWGTKTYTTDGRGAHPWAGSCLCGHCGLVPLGSKPSSDSSHRMCCYFHCSFYSQFKEWNSGTIEHDHLVEGR